MGEVEGDGCAGFIDHLSLHMLLRCLLAFQSVLICMLYPRDTQTAGPARALAIHAIPYARYTTQMHLATQTAGAERCATKTRVHRG